MFIDSLKYTIHRMKGLTGSTEPEYYYRIESEYPENDRTIEAKAFHEEEAVRDQLSSD